LQELYAEAHIFVINPPSSSLKIPNLKNIKIIKSSTDLISPDFYLSSEGKSLLKENIDLAFFGINAEVEDRNIGTNSPIQNQYNNVFEALLNLNLYDWTCIIDKQYCLYYPFQLEAYRGGKGIWKHNGLEMDLPQTLLSSNERERLFKLAHEGPGEGAIVNIGHFNGGSSIILASGSKLNKREEVFSFDINAEGFNSSADYLDKNNVRDWIIFKKRPSIDAARAWAKKEDTKIRLLFIDGDHSYEGCKNDIQEWSRYVIPGGLIAIHDYGNIYLEKDECPSIIRAVYDTLLNDKTFSNFECVDTLLLATKK
jgi:predicted O-methyltransferase YrrM